MRFAHRFANSPRTRQNYVGLTQKKHGQPIDWTGAVRQIEERLELPLTWRKPQRVFVDSMSDLFHRAVEFDFVRRVYDVMLAAPRHMFQVLTKRPERALEFFSWLTSLRYKAAVPRLPIPPHIWIGVSVENQRSLERVDSLRAIPAAVRFLSIEPLLEPLPGLDLTDIDWVIVGGESSYGAREMRAEWVRPIRDQCQDLGVPLLFKQWGAKHKTPKGRELDGVVWDQYPKRS
jgi:protein gp37